MKNVGSENPTKAKRGRDLVEERVGPHRRQDADGQRDEQGQELGGAEDEEGRGQALQDQGVHVDPAHEREAPVARAAWSVNQRT